jgi:mRNA interferase MazF
MGMVTQISRGEVWWIDFGEPFGSEPGFRRPALVLSSDRFNRSRIATVTVAAISSNLVLADAPGNVELEKGEAGLSKPSVVNISQTGVVDRQRFVDRIGSIGIAKMGRVSAGLRLLLEL